MPGKPTTPSLSLLVKLGSVLVHAEEITEPGAHTFDIKTLRALLSDPEVQSWRAEMDALALLPVKRSSKDTSLRPRPGETAEDTLERVVEAVRDKKA